VAQWLTLWISSPEVRDPRRGHTTATLGKLFTHIASPVFSAPRNWGTRVSIWRGLTAELIEGARLS